VPVLFENLPHVQAAPTVRVENRLAPGRHRFSLEVVTADGRRGRDAIVVEIVSRNSPRGRAPE